MGASSGWNLVARRPSRARLAAVKSTRHLVSVPTGQAAASSDAEPRQPASLRVVEEPQTDAS